MTHFMAGSRLPRDTGRGSRRNLDTTLGRDAEKAGGKNGVALTGPVQGTYCKKDGERHFFIIMIIKMFLGRQSGRR